MLAARLHPVVLLDVWPEGEIEVLREVVRAAVWSVDWRWRRAHPEQRSIRVAHRHDHDHRLRLPGRDQVVEDDARASDRGPCLIRVAGPVQEVEHGIPAVAGLIPR